MELNEQIKILNKAIVEKKPIHFCWNQENSTSEENGLVRVQTSYRGAMRYDAAPRDKETFLLLAPFGENWLMYVNFAGRTIVVRDPRFKETRGMRDLWFWVVESNHENGIFV